MKASPHRLLLPALLVLAACGGEVEEDPSTKPTSDDTAAPVPSSPSDPDFLPSGMYSVSMPAASCNVNDSFQRGDPMFLVRRGTGVNVPLPLRLAPANVTSFGTPRQDRDLERKSVKWTTKNESLCPGGSILVSMTITELTATRVAFEYREDPIDCVHTTCSVDFAFDLLERACPVKSDPSCTPGPRRVAVGSNAFQEVTCECTE